MTSQSINPSLFQKAISLCSTKRVSGVSENFQQRITIQPNNTFNKVSLIHASIPKGWYMVDTQTDIEYTDGSGTVTVQFPSTQVSRNYTTTDLCSELVTVLNAAAVSTTSGVTYTCVYDSNQSKFIITASAGDFNIDLVNSESTDYDLFRYLGLRTTNSSSSSVLTSPNRINLQRYDVVNLRCSLCNNSGDDVLTELYMAGTGSNDVFEYKTPDACMSARGMSDNQSNSIYVSLTDKDNKVIDMNGLEWSATIVCYDDRINCGRC